MLLSKPIQGLSRARNLFAAPLRSALSSAGDRDDEFYYPVHLIGHTSSKFVWDSSDIGIFCDLDPNKFESDKKIVHSQKEIKVLRTIHKDLGLVGFCFIRNQDKMWKISTISLIGESYADIQIDLIGSSIIDSWNHCDLSQSLLSKPYQFLSPPNCWSLYDDLTAQISDHETGDSFNLRKPFNNVLSSNNVAQISFGVNLVNATGYTKAMFDAFAIVNNASSEASRKICSIFLQKL